MNFVIDREYTLQTLVDLVQINFMNPDLADDGPGEAEMGLYVAAALCQLGLAVTVYDLGANRVNVVAC